MSPRLLSCGGEDGAKQPRGSISTGWFSRGAGVDKFFPERGGDSRPALALCEARPVAEACRAYALSFAPGAIHGVWAGTTGRSRSVGQT